MQQMSVPTYKADSVRAQPIQRYIRHLFNKELVDWQFEDLSIASTKIIGAIPLPHAPTHSYGGTDPISVENLASGNVDTTLVLRPDGFGGLYFGADVGGAMKYTAIGTGLYSLNAQTPNINNAISIGYNSFANSESLAIGGHAYTGQYQSIAIGHYANVQTSRSISLGTYAYVHPLATESISMGHNAQTYMDYSIAIGSDASAVSSYSIAIGRYSYTGATSSVAIGNNAFTAATSSSSIAIGVGSYVFNNADYSTAIGASSLISNDAIYSLAIGYGAISNTPYGFALGANSLARFTGSIAIGYSSYTNFYSTGVGTHTYTAYQSVTLGAYTVANFYGSIAIGYSAYTGGGNSIAIGYQAQTDNADSVAIGPSVVNANASSVEIGWDNTNKLVFNATDGLVVPDLRINTSNSIAAIAQTGYVTISINGVPTRFLTG